MIVVSKNEGEKIKYSSRGSKLTLRDEITIDLEKYERDFDVHIDISEDWMGILTTGPGKKYIAEIDIPARKYVEVQTEEARGEGIGGDGKNIRLEPVPFSMENVTLTLWAIV